MSVAALFNALAQILKVDKPVVVNIDGHDFEIESVDDTGAYTRLTVSQQAL